MTPTRCGWVTTDPLYLAYHDEEWGVPLHDEQKWYEFLILEMMEAGLSWILILRKREHFRAALDQFDPTKVAHYDEAKIAELMANPNIIRNGAKIKATVTNAQAFLKIQAEFGSFDAYIWQFVGGKPQINTWQTLAEIPTETPESQAMSKDMKKRGFRFVGPSVCYALMQATGMVNDHVIDCFRHAECTNVKK